MFEDEEIWAVVPGHANHILVVIFDPTADHFPVRQFQAHYFLFLSKGLEVGRFFEGLIGRRSSLFIGTWISWLLRHVVILQAAGQPVQSFFFYK